VKAQEKIWTLIKGIFSLETSLLENIDLDVILVCSIYAIAKLENIGISFQQLIDLYKLLPYMDLFFNSVVCQIQFNGQLIDIIKFYNSCFVTKARHLIIAIKENKEIITN
jgi:hypothetical protein